MTLGALYAVAIFFAEAFFAGLAGGLLGEALVLYIRARSGDDDEWGEP